MSEFKRLFESTQGPLIDLAMSKNYDYNEVSEKHKKILMMLQYFIKNATPEDLNEMDDFADMNINYRPSYEV